LLDGVVDRPGDTTELVIFFELQVTIAPMLDEEPFEGEGQEGQGVLASTLLEFAQEGLDQRRIDGKPVAGGLIAGRRTLDDGFEGAPGHR
jgi:hypothetical protein